MSNDNDLSTPAGGPRIIAPFAVFKQPEVEAPSDEMFAKFSGEQPRIDHPSADPESGSFAEFVKRRTAIREPEGEPFASNGGIDPEYGTALKLIPCVCGTQMIVSDGSTMQLGNTVHRTDGPCYKCESDGTPASDDELDPEPHLADEPSETVAAYDRDEPAPWLSDIPD